MKKLFLLIFASLAACAAPYYGPQPGPQEPPSRAVQTGGQCGGIAGFYCGNPNDFCRMSTAQQCGAADQTGICTPRPQMCTREYRPVCGCDGKTYSTECTANSAGISPAYEGTCR